MIEKKKLQKKNIVIIIVGTNASGKSSLAVTLAKKYNGEVISADSRQVYKGLDIGTGKVTEEEMEGIPHYLLDVVKPSKIYTAADFVRDGQTAIQDILSRGKIPIIAGGTGFYIDALLNYELVSNIPPNKKLRAELDKKSSEKLFAQLKRIDPKRAENLLSKNEQNHKRRLIRSIEIASSPAHSNTPIAQSVRNVELDALWIGIQWDKDELKKRIHTRLLARMYDGMLDEIRNLHKNGLSWRRMEDLGLEYRYLSRHLRGKLTEKEVLEVLETKIVQYAKQQRTWFKRNKDIHWFRKEEYDVVFNLVRDFSLEYTTLHLDSTPVFQKIN